MISHQRCKYCYQRKGMIEFTQHCPSNQMYGHSWETISGNGISWNESLIGKLWAKKYGKIIVIIFLLLLLMYI